MRSTPAVADPDPWRGIHGGLGGEFYIWNPLPPGKCERRGVGETAPFRLSFCWAKPRVLDGRHARVALRCAASPCFALPHLTYPGWCATAYYYQATALPSGVLDQQGGEGKKGEG